MLNKIKAFVNKVIAAVKEFFAELTTEDKSIVLVGLPEGMNQEVVETVKVKTAADKVLSAVGYSVLTVVSYYLVCMYPVTILYIMEMVAVTQFFIWVSKKVA